LNSRQRSSVIGQRSTVNGHLSSVNDSYLYTMESSVCVCGAGTMGRGIALCVTMQGMPVILYDLDPEMLSSASAFIENDLSQAVSKKRISAGEKENILRRISFSSRIADCRAPVIIEAIIEKTEVKCDLFRQLASVNMEDTLFATNTSSLSVTAIAEQTDFPGRVIGLHFFNPANRMQLVEIIRTKYNPDTIVQQLLAFTTRIGKTSVICQDTPGFIVNHVARPFYLEALRLAEKKMTDYSTIDKLMESAGFKMGPFHLMDLIGNDINYQVSRVLYEALGKPARLAPSGMQEALVSSGKLGKKTGSGFFQYTKSISE
jgi:3-hydroxybutyryl-CoA dehydrogenase